MLFKAPITADDKPWNRLAKQYYQKCLNEGLSFSEILRI